MERVELVVEHQYQGKFVGSSILKNTSELFVLGSSREASLRLLGAGVKPIHACIEFVNGHWSIYDLNGHSSDFLNDPNKIVMPLISKTKINIGEHTIIFTPKIIERQLFKDDESSMKTEGEKFHQIVIRKAGFVTETHLLGKNEVFNYAVSGQLKEFYPPKDSTWVKKSYADVVIMHRIASESKLQYSSVDKFQTVMDPTMKKPLLGAFVTLVLVTVMLLIQPLFNEKKEEENKLVKNKYTKIIYDAKSVRKKRKQAQKQLKQIAKSSPSSRPRRTTSKAVVRVVNKIKAAGLQKLIGKIAKRTGNTRNLIQAAGRVAGTGAGRAIASVGKTDFKDSNLKAGKTYKVGAVQKSGLDSTAKGVSGLAKLGHGNIGSADVGILEEETVVEGGLARDVIARTISKYLGQIRYCYERQLAANPDLYGKIMVKFSIGADGQVTSQAIGSSTMNNSMVEGCMLRKLARWKFPLPKGGTQVSVTYPFLFKSTQ